MWDVTPAFLDGLSTSMRMATKVNLYREGDLVAEDIAISDGSVTVDADSDVRRSADLTVADLSLLDVLDPYACDLRIWRGMVFGQYSIEWVPVATLRVWEVDYTRPGLGITVNAQDWGAMVASDEFIDPDVSPATAVCLDEIDRLLTDSGFPGVGGDVILDDTVGSRTVWDGTRWDAINELSSALDASVYFDQIGAPIIRNDAPGDSIWEVRAGEPDGVMVGSAVHVTREGTYNAVVAEGENPDADEPIRVVMKDNDIDSPTYWHDDPTEGGFGHSVRKESSGVWTTHDKAQRAARRLLRRSIGKVRTVDISTVPNPALEAGDVIYVQYVDGGDELLVIDSFTIPLVGGDFTMTARSKRTLDI